jgi:hypothetical protein
VTGQDGANAGGVIISSKANDADELFGSLQLEAQKAGSNNDSGRSGRPEFRNHGCRIHPVLRIKKIIFKRRIQIGTMPMVAIILRIRQDCASLKNCASPVRRPDFLYIKTQKI